MLCGPRPSLVSPNQLTFPASCVGAKKDKRLNPRIVHKNIKDSKKAVRRTRHGIRSTTLHVTISCRSLAPSIECQPKSRPRWTTLPSTLRVAARRESRSVGERLNHNNGFSPRPTPRQVLRLRLSHRILSSYRIP
jgi:hypothetical protein